MARKGKITIYLDETTHASTVSVRTTGALGSVPLNDITLDIPVNYAISGPTSYMVWKTVVDLVSSYL